MRRLKSVVRLDRGGRPVGGAGGWGSVRSGLKRAEDRAGAIIASFKGPTQV